MAHRLKNGSSACGVLQGAISAFREFLRSQGEIFGAGEDLGRIIVLT